MRTKTYTVEKFNESLQKAGAFVRDDIFERITDGALVTDASSIILYANRGMENLTGFSKKEMLGKTPGELWGNQNDRLFYKDMWRTIKTEKKPFAGVFHNRKKDGSKYYAELKIFPILDKNKRIVFFVGIESDVTKKIEAENNNSKMLSLIAHQIKSPLTAEEILFNSLINIAHQGNHFEEVGIIKKAQEVNKYLSNLIHDLLIWQRIQNSHQDFYISDKLKFSDIVEKIVQALNYIAEKKKIKIFIAGDKKLTITNAFLIQQILQNIIANAINYSRNKGRIFIKFKKDRKRIIFSCKDGGIGISDKDKENIFKPFFRSKNAQGYKSDGTGLGLHICKVIADHLGYKIWFSSLLNKGTTFFVEF